MLTAGCGAPLCVAAVKERDGTVVEDLPQGLQLEVTRAGCAWKTPAGLRVSLLPRGGGAAAAGTLSGMLRCAMGDAVSNQRLSNPPTPAPLQMFLVNNRLFEAERPPDQDVHQRLASSQLLKNAKVGLLVGWLVSLLSYAQRRAYTPGWPANGSAGAGCCARFPSLNKLLAPSAAPLQGSHLLLCGNGGMQQPSGAVRMPLSGPAVSLPELRVDGSSEGLLGSKLWGYRWGQCEA